MIVMFVGMGNTYRSRLAEAYLKSLELQGVSVMSAGVSAESNLNGPITYCAEDLMAKYGLGLFGKDNWTMLTQILLDHADMVVCMNRTVYEAAETHGFRFPLRTFIWSIAEVTRLIGYQRTEMGRIPHIAHKTFVEIVEHVNELATYIKRPRPKELIDILNADGSATGQKTDVDSIHTKGLWHQGVHAVVHTSDGSILFEKRSESIIGNPGLWDMTMGGICSAGENPDATVAREVFEELGIHVRKEQVRKLFVWRTNHYLPHYGLHNRGLVHSYLIEVEQPMPLKLQEAEVADAKWIPFAQAAQFVRAGHSDLGRLTSTHEFYRKMLIEVKRELVASST